MPDIPLTQSGPESGGDFEYSWESDLIQAHLISNVGKKREHNEDGCLMCAPEDKNLAQDRGLLFAVADGMGGVHGGEFASRLALQTLVDRYFNAPDSTIPDRLRVGVEDANQRIYEEAEHHPQYYGMGTTVSAVLVRGEYAYVAQVGDSRVYMSHGNGSIYQVTDDHSLVAEQVRSGYITEEEARNHSLKNLITRAVGTKETVNVDLFHTQIRKGDTILICSDGLCGVVEDADIAAAFANDSLQGIARVLVGRALEAGGPDNITAILVRLKDTPPKAALDQGSVKVSFGNTGLFAKLKSLFS
jgi:protein phosphatase